MYDVPGCEGARTRASSSSPRTTLAPALPYITRDAARRSVLRDALRRVPDEVLAPLRIRRFDIVADSAYDEVLKLERDAERHGYFALA